VSRQHDWAPNRDGINIIDEDDALCDESIDD